MGERDDPHDNPQDLGHTPLGKSTDYPQHYAPELLCPIARQLARSALGIDAGALPFNGEDIWTAYELSWLDQRGKPLVARASLRVPVYSPAIIESKSLKLYLNSLNQSRLGGREQVAEMLREDLSAAAGAPVAVALDDVDSGVIEGFAGDCLDDLAIDVSDYQVNPALLRAAGALVEEQLYSHLLRSLCPVTGQPDWASVRVSYRGPAIDRAGLLRYLVSYRQHQGFHEDCVERIYLDVWQRCNPELLRVEARYLRRGGLDINPCRSSDSHPFADTRLARQ